MALYCDENPCRAARPRGLGGLWRASFAALVAVALAAPAARAGAPAFVSDETGRMLRGMPGLTMFQRDFRTLSWGGDWGVQTTELEDVGCGPIAASNLLVWWMSRGYDRLADGYRTSSGRIDWQELAVHLREDRFNTGSGVGVNTYTTPASLEDGLRAFIEDQGYGVEVERKVVHDDDVAASMRDIRAAIDAGEPVVLLYDPLDGDGDTTIGGMTHYGVIVGYQDDDVFINEGLGARQDKRVRWNIGDGNVDLFFVHIRGTPDEDARFCVADEPASEHLADAPGDRRYTFAGDAYDDYAVLVHTAGERCGVLTNATTLTVDVELPAAGQIVTPGAHLALGLRATAAGRTTPWTVDGVTLWLKGVAGATVLARIDDAVLDNDTLAATVTGRLSADVAPGTYTLVASLSVDNGGVRSVLQEESDAFYVLAAPPLATVPASATATIGDGRGAWRSRSWRVEPGSGFFDLEVTVDGAARVSVLELGGSSGSAAVTTLIDRTATASSPVRFGWTDETAARSFLVVAEGMAAVGDAGVALRVDGEAVRILPWATPDGHAWLTATDGLGLAIGESVDIAYAVPATSLVAATLQATTSPVIAGRATNPGYVIEAIAAPAFGDRTTTIDAAASPHRQRSGTVVVRNDGWMRERVLLRVTRTGLAAGFVLDVNVFSVASRVSGSLVNGVIDVDAYRGDVHQESQTVDRDRPATFRLVRVPAGRALRVQAIAAARNGATVDPTQHVAFRVLSDDARTLLAAGNGRVEVAATSADRTLLVQTDGPQVLLTATTDRLVATVRLQLP